MDGVDKIMDEHELQPNAELALCAGFSFFTSEDQVGRHLIERYEEENQVDHDAFVYRFTDLVAEAVANRKTISLCIK